MKMHRMEHCKRQLKIGRHGRRTHFPGVVKELNRQLRKMDRKIGLAEIEQQLEDESRIPIETAVVDEEGRAEAVIVMEHINSWLNDLWWAYSEMSPEARRWIDGTVISDMRLLSPEVRKQLDEI